MEETLSESQQTELCQVYNPVERPKDHLSLLKQCYPFRLLSDPVSKVCQFHEICNFQTFSNLIRPSSSVLCVHIVRLGFTIV